MKYILHNVKSNHTGGKAGPGNTFTILCEYAEPEKQNFLETDHGFLALAVTKSFIYLDESAEGRQTNS